MDRCVPSSLPLMAGKPANSQTHLVRFGSTSGECFGDVDPQLAQYLGSLCQRVKVLSLIGPSRMKFRVRNLVVRPRNYCQPIGQDDKGGKFRSALNSTDERGFCSLVGVFGSLQFVHDSMVGGVYRTSDGQLRLCVPAAARIYCRRWPGARPGRTGGGSERYSWPVGVRQTVVRPSTATSQPGWCLMVCDLAHRPWPLAAVVGPPCS